MPLACTLGATQTRLCAARLQLRNESAHAFGIRAKFCGAFIDRRRNNCQGFLPEVKERCLGGTWNAMALRFHCESVRFGTGRSANTFFLGGLDIVGNSGASRGGIP